MTCSESKSSGATQVTSVQIASGQPLSTKALPTSAPIPTAVGDDDPLSSGSLKSAIRTLVELAVELEQIANALEHGAADGDADIYQDLFDLAGTRKLLEVVVSKLLEHRQKRSITVEYCRALQFASEVTAALPASTDLPVDAKTRVLVIARRNGIELSEDTAAKVCEAARRQEGLTGQSDSRGVRIVRALGFDSPEARTIDGHLSLLKPGSKQFASGKFKYPAQLDAAFHEGVAGTDALKYFLDAIGSDVPHAAELALKAWSEALEESVADAVARLG